MKRLRVRVTPDPTVAPRAFELLADSAAIDETRLLEWNAGDDGRPTLLFTVEGDWAGIDEDLRNDPAVVRSEATAVTERQAVVLVTLQPQATPLAAAIFDALTRSGVVIDTPVVYRDGSVHASLVGESTVLQSVIEAFPDAVSVDVQEVGGFDGDGAGPALSDRQREAVLAGLELGYYAVPREATHEVVAERLGCSPSTASEHLQKAEAKLVRAAMGVQNE